jgi:NADH dehydrogenase/NADH:ubiquinone oxidoreductase subunit G
LPERGGPESEYSDMVKVRIDGRELEADENQSVLEAALAAGIRIPALCHHKQLMPYGACRVCLVEIVGGARPGLQASCLYRCTEGLEIRTDTERVRKARRVVLELLLARCPEAEPIRALAAEYGVTAPRFKLKADNCILCGLCVRACAEVARRDAITFSGRGSRRAVGTPFRRLADACIGCGACVYVCPTRIIEIEEQD